MMRRSALVFVLALAAGMLLLRGASPPPHPPHGELRRDVQARFGAPALEGGGNRSAALFAASVAGYRLERPPREGATYAVYTSGLVRRVCTVVVYDSAQRVVDVVDGRGG